MADRPYFRDLTRAVFRRAERALSSGDSDELQTCLSELARRRRGAELAALVKQRRGELRRGSMDLLVELPPEEHSGLRFFMDAAIEPERLRAVRSARSRVLLVTYCLDYDQEFARVLRQRARARVSIEIIVSPGPARNASCRRMLDALDGAAKVHTTTSHGKIVAVDDDYLLLGSANLKRVHRDFMVQITSRRAVEIAYDYRRGLTASASAVASVSPSVRRTSLGSTPPERRPS